MKTTQLTFLTPLALCILMGCPPTQNNDLPGELNDMSSDMASGEDMGSGEDLSMREDMPDMGEVDASQDMSTTPVTCELTGPPTTIALSEDTDFAIQAQLHCDAPPSVEGMTRSFLKEERPLDGKTGEVVISCEAEQTGGAWCTVTLLNLPMPPVELPTRRGEHPLTLSSPTLEPVTIPLRFHTPFDEIMAARPQPSTITLPKNFARCGLDMTARALADGSPVTFAVMMNDDSSAVVLSRHTLTSEPVMQSVAIQGDDLMASDFEVARLSDGKLSAGWWGYDDTHHTFCSTMLTVTSSGELDGQGSATCLASPVPLKRIIDVQWGVIEEGDLAQITARVMAITNEDTWVALRLFDGSVTQETDQEPTFLARPSSEITGGNTGFLRTRVEEVSVSSETKVWQTSPLPLFEDGATRDGSLLTVLTIGEDEAIATLDLPTNFPVKETFVGHSDTGKIFVLLLGATFEEALFETELIEMNAALKAPVRKNIPAKTGLARSKRSPLDRRLREHQLKKKTTAPRQGFAPHAIDLISANGQTTALGRWPWDWRDRLKESATLQQDTLTPKPLDIHAGRIDVIPISVSWVDGASEPTLVTPLVAELLQPGQPLSLTPDTRAALLMTSEASAVQLATTTLSPGPCKVAERCVQQLSAPGAPSFHVGPGTTGLKLTLGSDVSQSQGEIASNVAITRPPTTVANASHAMENPIFQGQPGPNQSILAAIAPVDDPTRPTATHAVWAMTPDGTVSGPGFVQFITGNPDLALTHASVFESIALNVTLDAQGEMEIIAHAVVTQRYSEEGVAHGREALVQIDQEALLAAIGTDRVASVDLSAHPPFFIDDPETMPDTYKGESFFLPSLDESTSELSSRIEAIRSPETSLPATYTTYSVAMGGKRTTALVLISHSGEGNMSDYLHTVRPPGAEGEEALAALIEAMPDDGSEVVLGFGDLVGDGTQQAITAQLPDRSSEEPITINVYTLHTRRTSKRQEVERASYKMALRNEEASVEPMTGGDFAAGLSIRVDDFNGDGVDDLSMTSGIVGRQRQRAEVVFGADRAQYRTQVVLGDGQGGFLSQQIWMDTPPSPVCSGSCASKTDDPPVYVLTTHVCHF